MATTYTMFGFDGDDAPVVLTNVTAQQARAVAEAKGVDGFFLSPQHPHAQDNPGFVTYERGDDGKHHKVRLRRWVGKYLIDLKDDDAR